MLAVRIDKSQLYTALHHCNSLAVLMTSTLYGNLKPVQNVDSWGQYQSLIIKKGEECVILQWQPIFSALLKIKIVTIHVSV